MLNPLKRRTKHGQKGSSLVMMALSLSALMFTGGIVVDLGSYYSQVSKLQNTADAAASAGASVYVDKGTTRLIPISNEIDEDGNFTYNMDGQSFTFKVIDTKKSEADTLAEYYVEKNNETVSESTMQTRLWEDKTTSTLANGTTTSYTDAYAYRVDLSKPVELYFSKLFGMDSYPANASAMAVFIIEPDKENINDFIEEISANIYNTIPNYYWEAIHATNDIYIYTPASESAAGVGDTLIKRKGYGNKNTTYFTTDFGTYISQKFVSIEPLDDKNTVAYAYSDKSLSEKWCADPIHGTDKVGLTKMVYNLNKKMIQETVKNSEITGLFLDRPNTGHNANGIVGSLIRATELNITDEEISADNTTPLYMRFESEPIRIGSPTFAQPIIINVNGKQKKPLVIAYDGPDALRDETDAPRVDPSTGAYHSSGYTLTSTITPPPYTINLKTDFNGVIYAPFSRVTITGSGKVIGFILAKEIIDSPDKPASRKAITATNVTLPTWGIPVSQKGYLYGYQVKNITGSFSVVYDDFYNYTKIAPSL